MFGGNGGKRLAGPHYGEPCVEDGPFSDLQLPFTMAIDSDHIVAGMHCLIRNFSNDDSRQSPGTLPGHRVKSKVIYDLMRQKITTISGTASKQVRTETYPMVFAAISFD